VQEVSGTYTSPFLDTDDLKMALRARKLFGAFEKRAPGRFSVVFLRVVLTKTTEDRPRPYKNNRGPITVPHCYIAFAGFRKQNK